MKQFRRTSALVISITIFACDRAKSPPPVDSATVKPAGVADSAIATRVNNWDQSAGPLLLVVADSPNRAFVVAPDSASASTTLANLPHPASVTLLSRSGTVQNAELPTVADSGVCTTATLNAAPPPRAWNVGFAGGVVSPIPVDSLESISHTDSVSLVVWLNRLASALPNDSAGRFTGLPFVVGAIWRINVPGGPQVVVANLDRRINQEASPLQERTFLVAERAPSDSALATVYSERVYGAEETIQNQDILAASLLGANKNLGLIVSRDFGDAIAYALIERDDAGRWRQRWVSARRHC